MQWSNELFLNDDSDDYDAGVPQLSDVECCLKCYSILKRKVDSFSSFFASNAQEVDGDAFLQSTQSLSSNNFADNAMEIVCRGEERRLNAELGITGRAVPLYKVYVENYRELHSVYSRGSRKEQPKSMRTLIRNLTCNTSLFCVSSRDRGKGSIIVSKATLNFFYSSRPDSGGGRTGARACRICMTRSGLWQECTSRVSAEKTSGMGAWNMGVRN